MWSLTTKILCVDIKKALNKFFKKECCLLYATHTKTSCINLKEVEVELKNILQSSKDFPIPYDEVIKNVLKNTNSLTKDETSTTNQIFKSCDTLRLPELALHYYKFLKRENYKFSNVQYFLILKALGKCPEGCLKKEDLIELYHDLKPVLQEEKSFEQVAPKVFCQVQDLWYEIKDSSVFQTSAAAAYLIAAAFNFNFPEYGWNLLKQNILMTPVIEESYFNYCIQLAQNNKFTVEVLNDFIEFCKDNVLMLSQEFSFKQLKALAEILNLKKDMPYLWSVNKTKISLDGHCSHCQSKLLDVGINKKEFEMLKNHVLSDIIVNKNVNIKTSETEIKNFLRFLEKNPCFDIVLDGLNIFHFTSDFTLSIDIVKELLSKQLKVLWIGKSYLKSKPGFGTLKKLCKIFFANNLSDDDVFFIYAAMYKGLNTKILTCDYLRGYGSLLTNKDLRNLFTKWQFTHQYTINANSCEIVPPQSHSYLPQVTKMNEKNYCAHIPIKLTNFNFAATSRLNHIWLCITRMPKRNNQKKKESK